MKKQILVWVCSTLVGASWLFTARILADIASRASDISVAVFGVSALIFGIAGTVVSVISAAWLLMSLAKGTQREE